MEITQNQREYWQKNLNITAILMGVWFVVTFVVAYFARDLNFTFFGWPFSFWAASSKRLNAFKKHAIWTLNSTGLGMGWVWC